MNLLVWLSIKKISKFYPCRDFFGGEGGGGGDVGLSHSVRLANIYSFKVWHMHNVQILYMNICITSCWYVKFVNSRANKLQNEQVKQTGFICLLYNLLFNIYTVHCRVRPLLHCGSPWRNRKMLHHWLPRLERCKFINVTVFKNVVQKVHLVETRNNYKTPNIFASIVCVNSK